MKLSGNTDTVHYKNYSPIISKIYESVLSLNKQFNDQKQDKWVIPENIHIFPNRQNWKLTSLVISDVLRHLLLSETILSPLPLWKAEIFSMGE
jgi:hypothetical protein